MENKQTNKQEGLYSHWKSAVFDLSGWEKVTREELPNYVKKIHQQKEICPSTQREHYQVHVELHRQQRLSAMRGWIQSHWEGVKGTNHIRNSIAYCSKKESAVEGTQSVIENEEEYLRLHDLLLQIAEEFEPNIRELETADDPAKALRLMKEYDDQFLFRTPVSG